MIGSDYSWGKGKEKETNQEKGGSSVSYDDSHIGKIKVPTALCGQRKLGGRGRKFQS